MTEAVPPTHWHSSEYSELLTFLESRPEGLSEQEAASRLLVHGLNRLPESPPRAWWTILVSQFQSPLIYILGLAALISMLIGDHKDAGFIALVLLINAAIGCYQEWRRIKSR